jgi:hypothetical protein
MNSCSTSSNPTGDSWKPEGPLHGPACNLQELSKWTPTRLLNGERKKKKKKQEIAASYQQIQQTDLPIDDCMAYLGPGAVLSLLVVAALLLLLPLCLPPLPPPPLSLLFIPFVSMLLLCFLALVTPYHEFPDNFKPLE